MLTQFRSKKPNANYLEWEKAIAEVDKICDARIGYNQELKKFLNEESLKNIACFFRSTFENSADSFSVNKNLLTYKKIMINNIFEEYRCYEGIKKIISTKIHNQEMIDELHSIVFKEYGVRSFLEKDEFLKDEVRTTFYEKLFLKEVLDKVQPLISEAGAHFMCDR